MFSLVTITMTQRCCNNSCTTCFCKTTDAACHHFAASSQQITVWKRLLELSWWVKQPQLALDIFNLKRCLLSLLSSFCLNELQKKPASSLEAKCSTVFTSYLPAGFKNDKSMIFESSVAENDLKRVVKQKAGAVGWTELDKHIYESRSNCHPYWYLCCCCDLSLFITGHNSLYADVGFSSASQEKGGKLIGGCWALLGWRARPACLYWPTFSIPHVFVHFSSLTSGDPLCYCKLYSHQENRCIREKRWKPTGAWLLSKGTYNESCKSCCSSRKNSICN